MIQALTKPMRSSEISEHCHDQNMQQNTKIVSRFCLIDLCIIMLSGACVKNVDTGLLDFCLI